MKIHILLKGLFAAALFATAGCDEGNKNLLSRERVGACSWSWRLPMKDVATVMDKAGVKGIQLALGPFIEADGRHGEAESPETLKFVKEKIASGEWKLMNTMISFPQEDYTTLETIRKTGGIVPDDSWERNRRMITAAAKLTRELGAKYLLTHAGFLDEHDQQAYKKYVERVSWVRDECKRYGVQIMLETGQETADDLVKFLTDVPGLAVNFDPANMILYGKGEPVAALKKLFPWIVGVHIKDAKKTKVPGTWGEEVPWGTGEVDAGKFIAELEKLGYKGFYVVEREAGDNRAADIALAVERLMK